MKNLPDFTAEVFADGFPLDPDEHGFISKLYNGTRMTLEIRMLDTANILVAMVHGKSREIHLSRNNPIGDEDRYQLSTPVRKTKRDDFPCIDHNQSSFLLVQLEKNGHFKMWQVGLVSQEGSCFLHGQPTREGQCYLDGSNIYIPNVSPWPSFERLVSEQLGDNIQLLPSKDQYCPPTENLPPAGFASVKWFNRFLQYGFVTLSDGRSAMLHVNNIVSSNPKRLRHVDAGQLVRYGNVKGKNPGKLPQLEEVQPA